MLWLSLACTLYTQDSIPLSPNRWQLAKNDINLTARGVLHTYSRPLQWKKQDWLKAGGILLGTGLIHLLDKPANEFLVRQNSGIPNIVQDFAFYFGKPQYNYGLTASLFAIGILSKNQKIRRTSILLISSATAAGLIQTFSKTAFGRARPSAEQGTRHFRLWNSEPNYHSFPSGHTILAFTTAHVLAKQVKQPWLKVGIYSLGMVTPISRLWRNGHWLSDVALSMAISVVVVDSIDKWLSKEPGSPNAKRISWQMQYQQGGLGLVGTF